MASLLGEAKKRIARAEFEATTDGLTGVFNHRYLHEYLADEISRAMIHQSQFAVLFIDIDLFKAFNDVWGHSSGDAALRAVAHIIEGQIRRGDIVARYGGEEFVAILSDTDLEGGLRVAERIRQKVGQSPLVVGTAPITVSIGVAVFPVARHVKDGTNPNRGLGHVCRQTIRTQPGPGIFRRSLALPPERRARASDEWRRRLALRRPIRSLLPTREPGLRHFAKVLVSTLPINGSTISLTTWRPTS